MKASKTVPTSIAPTIILIIVVLAYIMYMDTLSQPRQIERTQNVDKDHRIVLIVNKSIEEWKNLYREYISYSDNMYKKYNVVSAEYNIQLLYSIIDSAEPKYINKTFYLFDPIPCKRVILRILIPEFAIELYLNNAPAWGPDPYIKAVAETLKHYVNEYPKYRDYRLAYLILQIASHIHYEWSPKHGDPLLEIVYDEGDCTTKTVLAIELASGAGLWSASLVARPCKLNDFSVGHEYVAIAIKDAPEWLKKKFYFKWRNMTFFIAEVAVDASWPKFPIEPYPCSYVEAIYEPYTSKAYSINKPLW